jgi:hypothetical protein
MEGRQLPDAEAQSSWDRLFLNSEQSRDLVLLICQEMERRNETDNPDYLQGCVNLESRLRNKRSLFEPRMPEANWTRTFLENIRMMDELWREFEETHDLIPMTDVENAYLLHMKGSNHTYEGIEHFRYSRGIVHFFYNITDPSPRPRTGGNIRFT